MKATKAKLTQDLDDACKIIITVYQLTHFWTLKECQQLWAYSYRLCPIPSGIWDKGNGNMELGVATMDEVPCALNLIWQWIEQQFDNNEGTD